MLERECGSSMPYQGASVNSERSTLLISLSHLSYFTCILSPAANPWPGLVLYSLRTSAQETQVRGQKLPPGKVASGKI